MSGVPFNVAFRSNQSVNRGENATENSSSPTPNVSHGASGPHINAGPRVGVRTSVLNTRAQLFELFFCRIALSYARLFPHTARRVIEFGFLMQAAFVLAILIYLHITFVRSPVTCLDHLRSDFEDLKSTYSLPDSEFVTAESSTKSSSKEQRDSWLRFGILRVEVIRSPDPSYSLTDSYAKEFYGSDTNYKSEDDIISHDADDYGVIADDEQINSQQYQLINYAKDFVSDVKYIWNSFISLPHLIYSYITDYFSRFTNLVSTGDGVEKVDHIEANNKQLHTSKRFSIYKLGKTLSIFARSLFFMEFFTLELINPLTWFFRDLPTRFSSFSAPVYMDDRYIIEYASEYGFLRLSPDVRKNLNITVKLVVLDPEKNKCFGSVFSRFLMEEFLGYEDLLLGSIKYLSTTQGVKGYVSNVMTGQHYRLVIAQMSISSYLASALIMLLFTFCVSILLRYSSQQLVIIIGDVLQMLETNSPFGIPVAPFMTVILALVAMETIMSEFFGDSIIAFYVILIVSVCDHYEAVFCRMGICRRYWPRFFYIYHFSFYAYHYRFNGQFSGVALWVSWLFILHSMIYFFHHYELPNLLSDFPEFIHNLNPNAHLIGRIQLSVPWNTETLTTAAIASSSTAVTSMTPYLSVTNSSEGVDNTVEPTNDDETINIDFVAEESDMESSPSSSLPRPPLLSSSEITSDSREETPTIVAE